MIVNRRTFIVKKGCSEKVVDMLRTVTGGMNGPDTVRIYEWYISPSDQVTWEGEFENLEAYAKFSAEWTANPRRSELLAKFNDLTVSGGTSEILKVS